MTTTPPDNDPASQAAASERYPLTPTQEGMLFHTLCEPGKGLYLERSELVIEGDLDLARFGSAWQIVSDRHAALRTYFTYGPDDQLLQCVLDEHPVAWVEKDWRALAAEDRQRKLAEFLDADLARELDPMQAPPFRVAAIRLEDRKTQVIITYHHALLDGWSFSIVWNEVFRHYQALARGEAAGIPRPRPFRDYIDWLSTRDHAQAAAFWQEAFAGYQAGAPLRLGRGAGSSAPVIRHRLAIGEQDTAALQQFARRSRMTFGTLLQGAWALTLRRYTGRDDVVYGVTTSGRPALLEGVDGMVGLFINTLPVRLQTPPHEPLVPWLKQVQKRHAGLLRHDYCSLAQVQGWCGLPGGSALFDSILVFENFANRDPLRELDPPLTMQQVSSFDRTNFPLTLVVKPGAALTLELIAEPTRFGDRAIERLLHDLGHLLTRLPDHEATPLDLLPMEHPGGADVDQAERFWRAALDGITTPTSLPLGRTAAPAGDSAPRHQRERRLPAPAMARLRTLARRQQLTLHTLVQGAWALLLGRYSGDEDVLFGTTISGRSPALPGVEPSDGLFIDTAPVRVRLPQQAAVGDWLRDLQCGLVDLREHAHSPLEQIQGWSRVPAGTPLFESLLVFEDDAVDRSLHATGDHLQADLAHAVTHTNLPLTLVVGLHDELVLRLACDAQRAGDAAIEQVLDHLTQLIEALPADPARPLAAVPMLSAGEEAALLARGQARARFAGETCLHERFAAQEHARPDAVAVTCLNDDGDGGETLTYAQLQRRAGQLAHRLQALGVGPDVRVGLCLERSVDMVVAILATLQAGGGYVPLDPAYPAERLGFVIADSGMRLLVTRAAERERLGAHAALGDLPQVLLDRDAGALAALPAQSPPNRATPDSLAYVIYTSGSTGTPKGVEVTHRNVARLFDATNADFGFGPDDVWTLFHSYAFDFSVWELWGALLHGGRVVVVPWLVARSPEAFRRLLSRERVTVLNQTPSAFRQLVHADQQIDQQIGDAGQDDAPLALRTVIFGGEALEPAALQPWVARHGLDAPRLINMYGITETTVHVTYRPLTAADMDRARSPIGRPLADLSLYVLDQHMRPVPAGVPGELYVGGGGVARGYLNRPALTTERFIPNPFDDTPGARLYRSGDLARWTHDGDLEYLGRNDDQVKIRGFRIELGEIQAALAQHPQVGEAVVVDRRSPSGDVQLVGYFVGEDTLAADVRRHLENRLPGYMVPLLVALARIPLTPNGKLDREALPDPIAARTAARPAAAPAGSMEHAVSAIWSELLGAPPEVAANFFDVGGHSLLLARLHRKLRKRFEVAFPLGELFKHTTIRAQAGYLERLRSNAVQDHAAPGAALARRRAAAGRAGLSDIAVIGMAGRFPKAPDVDAFWNNLKRGVECVTFFSREELIEAGIDPALLDDPDYIPANCPLEGVDEFDAGFFGFTPREAEIMDPQHRLLLACAWEALEDAGHAAQTTPLPVGVWAGSSISTYMLFHLFNRGGVGKLPGGFRTLMLNDKDYLATRIAYKLDLRGPAMSVQTACSTSLVAVHQACQSLLAGECAMAMAGGVSISLPQKTGYSYVAGDILSPDGHCRPFDHRSAGTFSGDGAGMVVLKRLEDAVRDGDHIRGVIKGSAVNNDGLEKIGYTAPSPAGQAEVIHAAQVQAQVHPESITCIEAHGTGTVLGDPIEIEALTQAFRARTGKTGYCAIGSVKSNIGHLDAAAGVAGLIKTVLMLEHQTLVPTLNFDEPNPKIDFARSPFVVNTELRHWPAGDTPRRAGVSSFGMGGTNAHVVLEEAPPAETGDPGRPYTLLPISARSTASLEQATDNLAAHLQAHPRADLADVGATLQRGRKVFAQRRFLVARPGDDPGALLAGRAPGRLATGASQRRCSVAFLFPGQGTQHVDMGRRLYEREPVFRDAVDRCASLLEPLLGADVRDLLYPAPEAAEAAAIKLNRTDHAQPALFTVQYAAARLWMAWGIVPEAMLGHSIGEYTAACLAGVLGLEDALALVAERGRLMASLRPGAMLAVFLSEDETRGMMEPELSLAAVNGPKLCVVSGSFAAIDSFQARLANERIGHRELVTSHAFHSAMMDPILDAFTARVRGVDLQPPRIPYLSNLTGDWITPEQATAPEYWARHLRSTVRFAAGVSQLLADEDALLLEVGAGTTMRAMIASQQDSRDRVVSTMRAPKEDRDDQEVLIDALGRLWLSGAAVDWSGFYQGQRRCRVPLPTYPFERRSYWIGAVAGAGAAAEHLSDQGPEAEAGARSGAPSGGEALSRAVYPRPDLATPYLAPRDEVEEILCAIWQQAFGFQMIGVNDNYFDLGGDSMLALQMDVLANNHGVPFTPIDIAEYQTIAALARLPWISKHVHAAKGNGPSRPHLEPAPFELARVDQTELARLRDRWPELEDVYLLTPMQQTILQHQRQTPGLRTYLGRVSARLCGTLDIGAFERAWQMVSDQHPVMRSVFAITDHPASSRQAVLGNHRIDWSFVDWRDQSADAQERALARLLRDEIERGLDLENKPPIRFTLICMGNEDHRLVLTYHHILLDDWGLTLAWNRAFACYDSLRKGETPALAPVPPFRQFIGWLVDQDHDAARAYWQDLLAGMPAHAAIAEGARADVAGSVASPSERMVLDRSTTDLVRSTVRGQQLPLGLLMQGLWTFLLGRYTGKRDVVYGVKIAGRPSDLAGSTEIPGMFTNVVPCRLQLNPDEQAMSWLRMLQEYNRELHLYEHQPLAAICEWAGVPADAPMFESMIALEDFRIEEPFRTQELDLRLDEWDLFRRTHPPLTMVLAIIDGCFCIKIDYQEKLFSPRAVRHILDDYRILLDAFLENPDRTIGDMQRALKGRPDLDM